MKITLMTVGSHGDVRPYVALAKGLQAQGARPCIATHAEFGPWIQGLGLDFHPVKGNPRDVLQGEAGQNLLRTGANPLRFVQAFKAAAQDAMQEGFDDCLAAAQGADAVVAPFFVAPIAGLITQVLRQKLVLGYLQPITPTQSFPMMLLPFYLGGWLNRASHQLTRQLFWQTFYDITADWSQARLNVKPSRLSPFGQLEKQALVLCAYSRYLVPHPPDWPANHHTTGFWLLDAAADYQPPDVLNDFLASGEKPVYVGFGSMSNEDPEATTRTVLAALERTRQRAVMLSGWGGLVQSDVSENILMLDAVPHDWLFPRMRALVHHAGAGTTAAGLHAGVPAVPVPYFGDQPFWAQRLFGMGAGVRPVPRVRLSTERLARALEAAVEPRLQERAAALGLQVNKEQGVQTAVQQITRFLA
ncbi:MAG: glycosyltransferase family 1 protein [Candidatus Sericytochromatia bacterium]|nr:glycosyltransferase family 1 protein [Candidatus Sericytochromatia bacterium]